MLKVGEKAPDFWLPDQDGKIVKLSDFLGGKVVVYFYPKDDTPGCTAEACEFRDNLGEYTRRNMTVLGISADGSDSHIKFRKKYGLNFKLLSDLDKKVSERWGTWGKKKIFGAELEGMLRTTFLIDEKGFVKAVFENVKPDGHAKEILGKS